MGCDAGDYSNGIGRLDDCSGRGVRAAHQSGGSVNFSSVAPTVQWQLYSGPGTVMFGDATQAATTANFSAPGIYTLMLSANDGIHAVAYDAVVITVSQPIWITTTLTGTNVSLTWTGGLGPYLLQQSETRAPSIWSGVLTTSSQNATLPITNASSFFAFRDSDGEFVPQPSSPGSR
jgi:hypothetical protein